MATAMPPAAHRPISHAKPLNTMPAGLPSGLAVDFVLRVMSDLWFGWEPRDGSLGLLFAVGVAMRCESLLL